MLTRRSNAPPTTAREDVITILVTTWVMLGLFVDGYAHSEIIDTETEDFFTLWHAIFYSGFIATAAWIGLLAWRRQRPGTSVAEWLPPGYGLGGIGLLVFAAGGIGDGIWHQALGVETGIDALLSPTHILLFVGMILIFTCPLRARWARDTDHEPKLREFAVPLASLTLTTALVAFAFAYLWVPSFERPMLSRYLPETGFGEESVAFGIAGALVSTVVLMTPMVIAARRWHPPFGSFTLLFTAVNLLVVATFDNELLAVPVGLAGGLAADLVLRWRGPHVHRVRAAALAAPIALWSVYVFIVGLGNDIVWQPELWSGMIFFAGMAGLLLAVLAFPQKLPHTIDA